MRCVVEPYGMTDGIARARNIEVDLTEGARLSDLVAALRIARPTFDGKVIQPRENKLTRHYVFNVNGRFYVDEYDLELRAEDHIVLLTFALGG